MPKRGSSSLFLLTIFFFSAFVLKDSFAGADRFRCSWLVDSSPPVFASPLRDSPAAADRLLDREERVLNPFLPLCGLLCASACSRSFSLEVSLICSIVDERHS